MLAETYAVLKQYYKQWYAAFMFYAGTGSGSDPYHMPLNSFTQFLDDCCIADSESQFIKRSDCDTIFIVCNFQPDKKSAEAAVNLENALMRYEFLEALCRAGLAKYGKGIATDDVSVGLEKVWTMDGSIVRSLSFSRRCASPGWPSSGARGSRWTKRVWGGESVECDAGKVAEQGDSDGRREYEEGKSVECDAGKAAGQGDSDGRHEYGEGESVECDAGKVAGQGARDTRRSNAANAAGSAGGVATAVRMLLEENVVPNLPPAAAVVSNKFREERLYNEEVDLLYKRHA
eukprot:176366-Chlamydomonas_euryale.AAC.1